MLSVKKWLVSAIIGFMGIATIGSSNVKADWDDEPLLITKEGKYSVKYDSVDEIKIKPKKTGVYSFIATVKKPFSEARMVVESDIDYDDDDFKSYDYEQAVLKNYKGKGKVKLTKKIYLYFKK